MLPFFHSQFVLQSCQLNMLQELNIAWCFNLKNLPPSTVPAPKKLKLEPLGVKILIMHFAHRLFLVIEVYLIMGANMLVSSV